MKHLFSLVVGLLVTVLVSACVPVHTYCPSGACKAPPPKVITIPAIVPTTPAPTPAPVQSMAPFILHGVNFHINSYNLTPAATDTLNKALVYANKYPHTDFLVNGYCSKLGSFAYNKQLSIKRANSVANWLTSHGISPSRLTVHGFSYNDPIATNSTKQGRFLNQRVEIIPVK